MLKNLGNTRKTAGDLEGAISSYRRALEIAPAHIPALYNLGLALRETNRRDEAEACFRRVRELDPNDAEALIHLGALVFDRAQFVEAERIFRAAVLLQPENPHLWMRLGAACQEQPGLLEESVLCLRRCLELDPGISEAYYRLGSSCKKLGMFDQAIDAYEHAVRLEPGAAEPHYELGNIFYELDRLEEAVGYFVDATRLAHDNAAPWINLGAAQLRLERWDEAIASLQTALRLQPGSIHAHLNLASVFSLRGERKLAIEHYAAILRLEPGDATAMGDILFQMQYVCDWSRFDELCGRRRRNVEAGTDGSATPFSLLTIPSTPAEQLRKATQHARELAHVVTRDRDRLDFRFARRPKPRIRVGYLSADFREHATAYLTAELFELHDRNDFEIVAYSFGPDDASPMRGRLRQAFDRFVDLAGISDAEAALKINDDEVDILVDLGGYTTLARTGIVALRPAPIQINYLGYLGTMGADFIDYLVADRVVIPLSDACHYGEKVIRMPDSFQVNDRRRPVAAWQARADLGLPEDAFVFCCFNQSYKILPRVFDTWMRLLQAVPRSVLWLLESNPWATKNLVREGMDRGVDPARLIFAPMAPRERYLSQLRAADVFLDTLPYNAGATASDALWAGLPVVTCAGVTFASRVAASVLHAAGLPELVCSSMNEYESLALRLATRPQETAALRKKLWRNRQAAPLFDTPVFVRGIETAYRGVWQNYLAGNAPQALQL